MQKMKTIGTCLAMLAGLAGTQVATGQTLDLGVKAGVNYGMLHSGAGAVSDASGKTGWHVGLFARTGNDFYFQPEVNYTSFSSEFSYEGQVYEPRFRQLNVPLMAGYRIISNGNMNLRVSAGPDVNLNLNTPVAPQATSYRRFTVGGVLNAGVDLGRATFDVRYSRGLTDINEGLKQKTGVLGFSVGFKIQ
ncbi:porin family protein [Parapedobacter composti]|nr:porin family protein [Parapedobacter composti]